MSAPIHRWLAEPMPTDVMAALERLAALDDAVHIAVMPDVHLAHEVCIGTVLATARTLVPHAIGSDVGCGVATLRIDGVTVDQLPGVDVLEALERHVPIHRHASRQPWPNGLAGDDLPEGLARAARRDGSVQLGTVGRGNHFVEVQGDDHGGVWIMAHSGSRAMGRAIQDHHGWTPVEADHAEGLAYLSRLSWAERYAAHNRQHLLLSAVRAVRDACPGVRPDPDTYLDCAHNNVRLEHHQGRDLWVHRKGALSAREGERGLIPGSMGTPSFHVEGRGHAPSLCSSSHGAGRAMSRTEARSTLRDRDVRRQLRGVTYRDGRTLREESPGAYRDIGAVMRAQRDLTRVVRRVRPVVVHKG